VFVIDQVFSSAKWLGKDALNPLAVDGKGGKSELLEKVALWVAARGRNIAQPGTFSSYRSCELPLIVPTQVMIVSYETLRTLSVYLAQCSIGLLLCDEGHRLKNSGQ
jgi:DNA repair and recombination protein RAD54 and RAD54-like protein